MPYRRTGDARRLWFGALFQSAGTPLLEAINNT